MPRAECTFRQRDLVAAIKAAKQAGVELQRVEVDKDGKISLLVGRPIDPAPASSEVVSKLEPTEIERLWLSNSKPPKG